MQILILTSVQLEPTTVMRMLSALILQLASTVPAKADLPEMDEIVQVLKYCMWNIVVVCTGDAAIKLKICYCILGLEFAPNHRVWKLISVACTYYRIAKLPYAEAISSGLYLPYPNLKGCCHSAGTGG